MKIAYIILAYKLPDQLVRLVRKLHTEDTFFFIHIDKEKGEELFHHVKGQLSNLDHVFFIRRIASKWGQLGCVKATLEGLNHLYALGSDFDYVINLSGQDYPIKTNQYIQDYLQKNKGLSYINFHSIPYLTHPHIDDWIYYWHFYWGKYHFVWPRENMFESSALNHIWNNLAKKITSRRKIPLGLSPYHGGSYWCLAREHVDYLHNFLNKNSSIISFFKYVQFPTEFFFQTILLNSQFKDELVNDDLRHIDFSAKKANPKILSQEDLEKFMSSSNLFARKFDSTVDPVVLDLIDKATKD